MKNIKLFGTAFVMMLLTACSQGKSSTSAATRITGNGTLELYKETSDSVVINVPANFYGSGGSGGYIYSKSSGAGDVTSTGSFTASTTGEVTLMVQDSAGSTAYYSFNVLASSSSSSSSAGGLTLYRSTGDALYTNGTAYFYAQGGTGTYTFSTNSGSSGSINSSSGVFTANSVAGTEGIQVYDGVNYAYYSVTVNATAGSCSGLATSNVARGGYADVYIDMASYSFLDPYVVHGVGVRFGGQRAVGLYMKADRLNADGSLDNNDSYSMRSGDTNAGNSTRGEIYVEMPNNYIVTGVDMGSDIYGEDVKFIKLTGVTWDSNGNATSQIDCYADRQGNQGCGSRIDLSGDYAVRNTWFQGSSNQAVRGLGVQLTGNSVSNIWVKTAAKQNSCN